MSLAALATWVAVAALQSKAQAGVIKATREWSGEAEDAALEKEKPAGGVITNKDDFAKLWKAWRGKEDVPEIDFDKEVVVVATSTKGRIFGPHLIGNDGDVKTAAAFMPKDLKGFTYTIGVFKREGLKSIDGKPIKK